MADFPRPSATNRGDGNLKSFTAEQPTRAKNTQPEIRSGAPLLKAHGVGKLNENRSKSLRPRKSK